jgi:hypothetical protein
LQRKLPVALLDSGASVRVDDDGNVVGQAPFDDDFVALISTPPVSERVGRCR